MSEVKTIKDVDDYVWAEFKSIAAQEKKKMGEVFKEMVKTYKDGKTVEWWKNFLTVNEPLTEYEAERIEKRIKEIRKESNFRDVKWD
jgi:hypothetical protein